VKNEQPITYE